MKRLPTVFTLILVLSIGVGLLGKNLFLRLILPIDRAPLTPPEENCQLANWPPTTDTSDIQIFGYDVGENKLTSVITGRPESWVPIKSYLIRHRDQLILVDPGPDRRRMGLGKDWFYNGIINHLINPIRFDARGGFDEVVRPIDQRIDSTIFLDETHRQPDGKPTPSYLQSKNISLTVLNHAHADHTGNLDLFPNATTMINQIEYDHALEVGARGGDNPAELARAAHLKTVRLSDAPPIATFAHGYDLLGDQTIYLVDLPGHTPGQTGVLVRTQKETSLLSSDALARTNDLVEKYAMPGQYNRRQFLESLAQIDCFRKTVPNAVILPGHDEPTPAHGV